MSIPDVVIIAGARTPFARINGNLAGQTAVQLGTVAIRGALERAGVSPDDVDAVIMGQVLQAGAGQNPAKQSAVITFLAVGVLGVALALIFARRAGVVERLARNQLFKEVLL